MQYSVLAVAAVMIVVACAAYTLSSKPDDAATVHAEQAELAETATTVLVETPVLDGGAALQFAKAYQDGNCDEIIRLTAWMSDRLRRVAIESSDPTVLQEARRDLCKKILTRPFEDNVLRSEGIEDQFVFVPGSQLEVVAKDKGRTDLGAAVSERVWIRVTYPRRETAPLAPTSTNGPEMKPVYAWTAGVNIGREDGVVLKAGVRGNLEIKDDSITFEWPEA